MIRLAAPGDWPAIWGIAQRMHARSADAGVPLDEQTCQMLFFQSLSAKKMRTWVAVAEGEVVGFLCGIEQALLYNAKKRFATDLVTCCERPGRGVALMKAFKKWAVEDRRVDMITMGCSFGGKEMTAIYNRLGLQRIGGLHQMRVSR